MSNRPKKSSYSIEDLLQLKPSRSRPSSTGPPKRLLPTSQSLTGHTSKKVSFNKDNKKQFYKLCPGGGLKVHLKPFSAHLKFNQPKLYTTIKFL